MKALILLVFFLSFYSSYSIEAINYKNEFSNSDVLFESSEHGLYIANSAGIYNIDFSDASVTAIQFGERYIKVSAFFDFENELYCINNSNLYVIRDGKLSDVLLDRVLEYYVKESKLYLIRSKEPRIVVYENSEFQNFTLGDNKGNELFQSFTEVNGEVYALINLNWSGNAFVVKIEDDRLEYLMSPNKSNHDVFKDKFPSKVYNINNELWVDVYDGFYRYDGVDLVKVTSDCPFYNFDIQDMIADESNIFMIANTGIYKYELENDELEKFKELDISYKNKVKALLGANNYYFRIDEEIYSLNKNSEELSTVDIINGDLMIDFIETKNEDLVLTKTDRIEKYDLGTNKEPEFLKSDGNISNKCHSIAEDKKNEKLLVLSTLDSNYVIQDYDNNFSSISVSGIKDRHAGTNTSPLFVRLRCDFDGNYFVSVDEYLSMWDGSNWESISLLDPSHDDANEDYKVLCTDSLGGVWVSASLSRPGEYYRNLLLRFEDQDYEIMYENEDDQFNHFMDALCTSSGDLYFSTDDQYLLHYSNDGFEQIVVSDCDNHPIFNKRYSMNENTKGNLVLTFNKSMGWSSDYGTFILDGGIIEYEDGEWNKESYSNLFQNYKIQFYNNKVFCDKYGSEYIFSYDSLYRVESDNKLDVIPINDLVIFDQTDVFKSGRDLWITDSRRGLYYIELPEINSVENSFTKENILKSDLVSSKLEFERMMDDFTIIDINGKQILSGTHSKLVDIELLSSGVYFILCSDYENEYIQQFIVKK